MRRDKTAKCASRYPYRHHGPAVHGSKLIDYLISEVALREDHPELFDEARDGPVLAGSVSVRNIFLGTPRRVDRRVSA